MKFLPHPPYLITPRLGKTNADVDARVNPLNGALWLAPGASRSVISADVAPRRRLKRTQLCGGLLVDGWATSTLPIPNDERLGIASQTYHRNCKREMNSVLRANHDLGPWFWFPSVRFFLKVFFILHYCEDIMRCVDVTPKVKDFVFKNYFLLLKYKGKNWFSPF